ncbi:MAG: hypothetical protein V4494_07680 [Chlamydiota bacterium]
MLSKKLVLALSLTLFTAHVACSESSACVGNIQDAPLSNFKNTPLKGWSAFAVSPIYSLEGPLHQKVILLTKKEFEKIGNITKLEIPDVTGLGTAANMLNLEVQKVKTWESKNTHLLRISLTLQTTTTINKTHQECGAYIWASSVFVEGDIVEINEKNLLSSIENLIKQFTTCYAASNPADAPKPTFYFYE